MQKSSSADTESVLEKVRISLSPDGIRIAANIDRVCHNPQSMASACKDFRSGHLWTGGWALSSHVDVGQSKPVATF